MIALLLSLALQPAAPRVLSAQLAGSGCPANQAAEATLDGAKLLVTIPEITAKTGAGVKRSESRANCTVTVKIEHGAGFKVSPEAATVVANGKVEGAEAKISLRAHIQGQQATESAEKVLTGQVSSEEVKLEPKKNFSPCEKTATLVLNYAVFVQETSPGKSSGQMGLKPLVTTLAWEACK